MLDLRIAGSTPVDDSGAPARSADSGLDASAAAR